jgi:hypothetical protein
VVRGKNTIEVLASRVNITSQNFLSNVSSENTLYKQNDEHGANRRTKPTLIKKNIFD